MADDLSKYAPTRSLRPFSRADAEAAEEAGLAALAERLREQEEYRATQMRQLAALEHRADMDPYLADDPLRRLGYRETGGLDNVTYLPLAPNIGRYFGAGYGVPEFLRELHELDRRGGDATTVSPESLPIFGSIAMLHPDRTAAFDRWDVDLLIPEGGIGVGPNYYADPVLAHEFGHAGVGVLFDRIAEDPELAQRMRDAEFYAKPPGRDLEEGVIEVGDRPDDWWNVPSGERATMEHTIQTYTEALSDRNRDKIERYNQIMQELAQEELARRGEPPRTQRREPEPEPSGVQRLLQSIFGGD